MSGSPVTTSGTLALCFASGYSLPSDATQATWTAKIGGSLTSGYIPGATGSNTISDSPLRYYLERIGIGVSPTNHNLQVSNGYAKTDTSTRNVALFGSNEANTAHGLSIAVIRHASSQASCRVALDVIENNTGSGGTLNLMPYAGSVVIGSNNVGFDALELTGNFKYSGTLKPGGAAGVAGQFLKSNGLADVRISGCMDLP
ncbi:hypothetical protein ACFP1I_30060 [Dyadobacter subterraneus]|uniref:Uncharacterized protein n=1 Tax=Dyadobacter subterraneus TaxID=2773304 RepID=A0ABR9WBF7_9BACT|nr:hypothetical protein [Dyadobacter subterraneus]MBE9462818.1 hypothetical protein [Dyadobacter subterraneus]